jgi:ribosomal protein S18 acetylase RimI-like enzyme
MSCGQDASDRRAGRIASAPFVIAAARGPADLEALRLLFLEYGRTPHVEECVRGFAAEIADLPGRYAAPRGTLLLASVNGEAAGCAGLLPLDTEVAEMKRLYVRPAFRGRRIGEALALAVVDAARARGYRRVVLSTLPSMAGAAAIYARNGFRATAAFDATLPPDTHFLELSL